MNAERCLKESEDRFQLMANNIAEVFWMMNANTKEVVYVSEAYKPSPDALGKSARIPPLTKSWSILRTARDSLQN